MKITSLLFFVSFPLLLLSQQHPLPVESASLLESGHAQFDFTAAYYRGQSYPLSGLTGDLTKFGNIRFAVSLSEYVELQTDGTLLNILRIKKREPAFNSGRIISTNPTADIGDFSVWTKFGLLNEYTTGIGFSVRFGIQLPNASNESGLGVDEMNFASSLLFQKHLAGKWTANLGLGILSDPTVTGQQHDVFNYSIEYSLPIGESSYLLLQYAGRRGHEGIGIYHLDNAKLIFERTSGDLSIRAAGIKNFSQYDTAEGVELTASYIFQLMEITR